MTHNARVLALLSDGQPHSHHEIYDLRVVGHSRIAALRAQGHTIVHWVEDGLHWYQLALDEDGVRLDHPPDGFPPTAVLVEGADPYAPAGTSCVPSVGVLDCQLALDVAA